MKIAIIGTGNLGYSIALGILNQSQFEYAHLYLTKRNTSALESLKNYQKWQFYRITKKQSQIQISY